MEDGGVEQTVEATFELASILLWTGLGLAIGIVGVTVILAVARVVGRRRRPIEFVERRLRTSLLVMGALVCGWIGFVAGTPQTLDEDQPGWRGIAQHGVVILMILVAVWIATSLVRAGEDIVLNRPGQDLESRHGRRVVTQAQILRRLVVAVIVIIGFASALFTFPEARTAGASLLASAGIASVVAGLAAQSTLGSVFAGLQIAMTDSLRVGDAVFVEGEFGLVEELTLTYVVVHVWDGRRIVMPSTYFTTTPFENWTRRSSEMLDSVEFDLDWRVPIDAMRAEMDRLLESKAGDLWDERVGLFQVLEATGGMVRVRALVSAKDAPTLVDLRYFLREELVKWVKREAPHSLPRTRIEGELADVESLRGVTDEQAFDSRPVRPMGGRGAVKRPPHPTAQEETRVLGPEEMFAEPSALYTGSAENERRAENFTGPDDDAQAEREEEAERRATESVFEDAYDRPQASSTRIGLTDQPNDGETQTIPAVEPRTAEERGEGTGRPTA